MSSPTYSDEEDTHLMSQHQDDEKADTSNTINHTRRRRKILEPPLTKTGLLTFIIITALVSTLLSGLTLHFLHILHPIHDKVLDPPPGTVFGSCGNTTGSARAAGCYFDVMSFSWLPPPCADPALTEEFLALSPWNWWLDQNSTMPVSFEEVKTGEHHIVFVSREFHMYHCTYMWRKLHRGMLKGIEAQEKDGAGRVLGVDGSEKKVGGGGSRAVVDNYIGSYAHTGHCEGMLMGDEMGMEIVKEATDTAIISKFVQCIYI